MATMTVKNAAGGDETVEKPLAPGRVAAASSRPIALSTEDLAALNALGSQTTLAAVLAKITADPATQTTLAAVLAKIIAAPATEAKQDTLIAKDFATQTTLAATNAALGATTGAAVITDANGAIQQYLRGLVTRWASAVGAGTAAAALRTTSASDDPVLAALVTDGVAIKDENDDPVDWLTPASVTLLQERTLPTTRWSYAAGAAGILNTTTAVTFKAADAALCNYITSIQLSSEALTTATEVAVRDGAGGTVLWRTKIGTGGLIAGREIVFATPLKGTAATLLEVVTLTASGAGAVYFNSQGFVAA